MTINSDSALGAAVVIGAVTLFFGAAIAVGTSQSKSEKKRLEELDKKHEAEKQKMQCLMDSRDFWGDCTAVTLKNPLVMKTGNAVFAFDYITRKVKKIYDSYCMEDLKENIREFELIYDILSGSDQKAIEVYLQACQKREIELQTRPSKTSRRFLIGDEVRD